MEGAKLPKKHFETFCFSYQVGTLALTEKLDLEGGGRGLGARKNKNIRRQ